MVNLVLFGLFAVLLLFGAPIAVCLGMSSVAAMLVMGAGRPINIVLGTVPQLVSAAITKSVLMAIPFFILGGNIMENPVFPPASSNLPRPVSATSKAASQWSACWLPASLQQFPAPARRLWRLSA